MGGFSSEFEISLKSGQVVYETLDRDKYNPYRIQISRENWVFISKQGEEFAVDKNDFSVMVNETRIKFDCVFNAIHGSPGEDGRIQAYLELIGMKVTGCTMYQAALTYNKRDCLSALKPYGIKSANAYFINSGDTANADDIIKKVGLPCFVKANRAGSSYGITKVYKKNAIQQALEIAFKEDREVLIESFLDGTEVSVGVISYNGEIKVLPITEIVSENDFFDYQAKYLGQSQEITPARISKEDAEKVSNLAKTIYQALGLNGFSRSEFILINGEPYLLEVNTVPGLTAESILPQQAMEAGISMRDLFGSAIEEALKTNLN